MADYKKFNQSYFDELEKERKIGIQKFSSENEKNALVSKNLENDETLKKFYEYKNTFKPRLIPKDPQTFCFFGSAKSRYNDAKYNIINYYPFDGTQSEVLEWHSASSPLDVAIVEKHWPSSVGHLQITNREHIDFFGGPQKLSNSQYTGRFAAGETPLKIDFDKGNTVEFWMKKGGWSGDTLETIFEVGNHPGAKATDRASFRFFLNQSSGSSQSPIFIDYKVDSHGFEEEQIGQNITNINVVDNQWHHYAIRGYQEKIFNDAGEATSAKIYLDLFIDGKKNHSLSKTISNNKILSPTDSYMAGTLFAPIGSSQGSFSGSLDEFRFWKGKRTNRELNRYFDQKIYASTINEEEYTNRLGVYYKFNKTILNNSDADSIVLDYSGNDMMAEIKRYSTNSRKQTSAIDNSSSSINVELPDLSLLEKDKRVIELSEELDNIAESYDKNNSNSIFKMIPDWANDPYGNKELNEQSDFYILLNLISEEFDQIKLNIDSIRLLSNRNFDTNLVNLGESSKNIQSINNPSKINLLSCSDQTTDMDIWPGNRIDFPQRNLEKLGFSVTSQPLELNLNPEDDFENIIGNVRLSMNPTNVKGLILDNVLIAANSILKKKGTERSFDQMLSCWGVDRNIVSFNVYGQNSEIDLNRKTKSVKVLKTKSFDFGSSPETTFFISSSVDPLSRSGNEGYHEVLNEDLNVIYPGADEARFISGSSYQTNNTLSEDYTFEGNFIFSNTATSSLPQKTSIFGITEVNFPRDEYATPTGPNPGDLKTATPDSSKVKIFVRKSKIDPFAARFEISSSASNANTSYINGVYDNSQWNLSVVVQKSGSIDSNFISGSSVPGNNKYQIVFSGHNYALDSLQNSFRETIEITQQQYDDFSESDKMVYLGCLREDITGSVISESNFKFLNLKAWKAALTEDEIKNLSQNINSWGLNNGIQFESGYSKENKNLHKNRSLIFKIDASGQTSIPSSGIVILKDFSSGSIDNIIKYGRLIGSKYNFASTEIPQDVRSDVIKTEYINTVYHQPLENIITNDEVKVRKSELDKFNINLKDESRVLSFEKSMYHHISEEMINFVSNINIFNNLIGEPINKYRHNYKMMDFFRQRFFENVENENQFERYVEYYRWIDHSLGSMLEQLVPASAQVNTGLHNVVESHALERNKYQYKMPIIKTNNKILEVAVQNTNFSNSRNSEPFELGATAEEEAAPERLIIPGYNNSPKGQGKG